MHREFADSVAQWPEDGRTVPPALVISETDLMVDGVNTIQELLEVPASA